MKTKIGIIIPYRNLAWATINLLDSIKANTDLSDLHFIFIDNGSDDENTGMMVDYLFKHTEFMHSYRYSKEPLGFVKAVNLGMIIVKEYGFEYFFILNNDILVTKNWLERMMKTLERDEVSIVGAVTNPIDWKNDYGKEFIDKKSKYSEIKNSLEGFSSNLKKYFNSEEKETGFVPFFCTGFKSKLLESVGMLDEDYGLGLYDDDDYCYRVRSKGGRVFIRQDVYIHHLYHMTFDEEGIDTRKELHKNRTIFMKKHGFDPWDRLK